MNKSMKMWMMAAILFCGVSFVGCGNNNTKQQPKEENKQVVDNKVDAAACDAAVVDYLVNVIGKSYAEGELCITSPFIVSADYGNPEDVKVWGDFWVFNYNQSGDTLKTVSGGNHPGLMHLKKTDKGIKWDSPWGPGRPGWHTECVVMIGKEFNSGIADYVKKNNLPVKMVQDYGWPAVELPK